MDVYNPNKDINPAQWLAIDESERQELVEHYVFLKEKGLEESVHGLHVTAHVIVENQLALDVKETVEAYKRLIRQGLSRHDTLHAIAAVILESINLSDIESEQDLNFRYKSRLRKLTAKRWLKGSY